MSKFKLSEMLEQLQREGGSGVEVGSNWFNGRAAYGGLVGALAATAMEEALEAPMPMRSLLVNFVGPVPAERIVVEPRVLRAGKSVTQTSVELTYEGKVLTQASAAFGLPRPGLSVAAPSYADLPVRDAVPALSNAAGMLPSFLSNFTIHWTGGAVPMSGSKDTTTGMWVRHKDAIDASPAAKIIAVADIPPPIMISHYTHMIKASSLSWALEFVRPPEDVKTDWFYLDFNLEAAADGYSQQSGRIYDEAGALCAISRQCMVYFE